MGKRTPLYDCHLQANAKIVDFAGWDMPLHYGSQIQEHHYVRQEVGMFDVSHMTIIDLQGKDSHVYLKQLVANDVDKLLPGKALYTCMLNESGGVIDDLIVYQMEKDRYRLIVNSATREKDLTWIHAQAKNQEITIKERNDLAMIAIQGPKARDKISAFLPASIVKSALALKPFHACHEKNYFIARTGYTGEDGFEVILPANDAPQFWQDALSQGVHCCGLGARDTLRLEAGLNLYGTDMDETVTPFESNLAWTVAMDPNDRNFIGRTALEKQLQSGIKNKLVGLVLETQGVLRNHQVVHVNGAGQGEITSGSFSPSLNKGIALARVPQETKDQAQVEIRGKPMVVKVVKLPFIKQGKKNF